LIVLRKERDRAWTMTVSSSTFSLREVELSSADAMTSLDGSRRSHFGYLLRVISVGTMIKFLDTEFCTSMDGSTVSLTEHVGQTVKQLWYDNEGVMFTHCNGKNPAPQPLLQALGVSH